MFSLILETFFIWYWEAFAKNDNEVVINSSALSDAQSAVSGIPAPAEVRYERLGDAEFLRKIFIGMGFLESYAYCNGFTGDVRRITPGGPISS